MCVGLILNHGNASRLLQKNNPFRAQNCRESNFKKNLVMGVALVLNMCGRYYVYLPHILSTKAFLWKWKSNFSLPTCRSTRSFCYNYFRTSSTINVFKWRRINYTLVFICILSVLLQQKFNVNFTSIFVFFI